MKLRPFSNLSESSFHESKWLEGIPVRPKRLAVLTSTEQTLICHVSGAQRDQIESVTKSKHTFFVRQ